MAKSKLVQINAEIADAVVGEFQKIEDTVVGGYRKIENAFVDRYLTRDGESVEEAKNRLAAEQRERQATEQAAHRQEPADAEKDAEGPCRTGRCPIAPSPTLCSERAAAEKPF